MFFIINVLVNIAGPIHVISIKEIVKDVLSTPPELPNENIVARISNHKIVGTPDKISTILIIIVSGILPANEPEIDP
ncbi:MAG: hypothetical protein RR585_14380 [Coprobacillus sp.]